MSKKLYLYLGLPKTGSSTINKFIIDNESLFIENGIDVFSNEKTAFIRSLSRTLIHKYLQKGKKKRKRARSWEIWDWYYSQEIQDISIIKSEVRNAISRSKYNTILISCIAFSGTIIDSDFKQEYYDELSELFSVFEEIHILVYIRNQAHYMTSFYQEQVKLGETVSFDIFYKEFVRYLNWYDIFQKLKIAFPNAVIYLEPLETIPHKNIINDFMSKLGVNFKSLNCSFNNVRLHYSLFPLLIKMNKHATVFDIYNKRRSFFTVLSRIQRREPIFFPYTKKQLCYLRKFHSKNNRQLLEKIDINNKELFSSRYIIMSFDQEQTGRKIMLDDSIKCFQDYFILFFDQLNKENKDNKIKFKSRVLRERTYGYLESFIKFMYPIKKKVALYGTGSHTKIFLDILKKEGISMPIILDDLSISQNIDNVNIQDAEGFNYSKIDNIIISSQTFERSIFNRLISRNVSKDKIITLYS